MSTLIIEMDAARLNTEGVTVTKIDSKGHRKGHMDLEAFTDLMRGVFNWDASNRKVRLVSRFDQSPYLAWGQNGPRWVAVKEIPAASYYLLSDTGRAYEVKLPRLIVRVSNYMEYGGTWIFWSRDTELSPTTPVYPLMIGNVDAFGRVCLGNTGLKCTAPDDIDQYIRKIIESPATAHYLRHKITLDKLYKALAGKWQPSIGKAHRTTLGKLLADDGG